ncbi:MAG: helix-turn-helix transcriptional regulator [Nitrospirota bacterium]
MNKYMNTRELSRYLGVNEKKIYSLIAEKRLPATKITGKWGFLKELVDIWLENSIENHQPILRRQKGLLLVAGSNDPLLNLILNELERAGEPLFPFLCTTGSLAGLSMLKARSVHISGSHLLDTANGEYNIPFLASHIPDFSVVAVNFAYRQQGLLIRGENPLKIKGIEDLVRPYIRFINRQKGSGTHLLVDEHLKRLGIDPSQVSGYETEVSTHLETGISILKGDADAGVGIRTIAEMLGLGFIPLQEERFDLLIPKDYFFFEEVQQFLDALKTSQFRGKAASLGGYDTRDSGRIIYTS